MPINVQVKGAPFQSATGTELQALLLFTYPSPIRVTHDDRADPLAWASIAGFDVKFSNQDDRHFGELSFRISLAVIQYFDLLVRVTYLLRDFSGNIDDPYEGAVDVLVIADIT